MNTVKRIARNTLILSFTEIAHRILALILIVYIARYLGDIGFGKYSFAFSFTGLFVAFFSDFGISVVTLRDVARDKSKTTKYLGNIIIIKFILSLITIVLIFILINLMNYPRDTTIAVYLIGLSVIFNNFALFLKSIFNAYEKMEYVALSTLLERLLSIFLGISVLVWGYGLIELASVFLFSSLCNILFCLIVTIKKFAIPKLEIDKTFWQYLIKTGFFFLAANIFYVIYFQIDVVMLSIMKGDAIVGWYSAAYNLVFSLIFIPGAFMSAVFPVMSRFHGSSEESLKIAYRKSFEYLWILGIPIAVGTTLLSSKFILFLYGTDFVNSIIALQVLIWAILFAFISISANRVLIVINKEKVVTSISAFLALFNIILNLSLIPSLSHVGASIATVITEGVGFVLYFYFVSKYLYKLPLLEISIRPMLAVVPMALFLLFTFNISFFISVPLSAFIYFATLFLLGGFSEVDIKLLRQIKK